MNLPRISVQRKVAMSCFIIMLVLLGLRSYPKVGIDLLPKFDVPYVQITTIYPGASPEEIEVEVARRIEDAVASMDGLKHTTTICMENAAGVTLEFELGVDVDIAVHEVREKLNAIAEDFPDAVETPKLSKINVNAIPVVTLYVTGDKSVDEIYDYVDDRLSDQFSSIRGVGEVRLHGGNDVEMHVILDRDKLSACNLTVAEVMAKIRANNLKLPAGRIKTGSGEVSLTYDAEFRNVQSMRELEVGATAGKRVYLGDIASIELKSKEIRQDAFLGGKPGVVVEIVKKDNANAVKVIDACRKKFDYLNKSGLVPGGMEIHWFKDYGAFVKASVKDAWNSILLGVILTAAILFLFLHEPRSTFIISITMPVSFAVTFAVMEWIGYTFDMMTLVSIGCSAGILVTNSVVVIENIFKHLQTGEKPAEAAEKGTSEVVNAVAASALTNVVVFVPVALMTSVAGLLISPFAGVQVIVTLISLFVSFTLTPMLAAILLKSGGPETEKKSLCIRMFKFWDRGYDAFQNAFMWSISLVRAHSGITIMAIMALCVVIMMRVIPHISMTFVPTNDKSELALALEFPGNSNLDSAQKRTSEIINELNTLPYVQSTGATVGYKNAVPGTLSEGVHIAEIIILTKPVGERPKIEIIKEDIRKRLEKHGNMRYSLALPSATGMSGAELQAIISGPEFDVLEKYAHRGAEILHSSGAAADIDTSVRPGKPRINLLPDRPILKNLGIDANVIGTSVVGFFEGIKSGTYKVGTRSYDIRVITEEERGLDQIDSIIAGSINGKPVNLNAIIKQESSPVSLSLARHDKERAAWIYANPSRGHSLGELVTVLNEKLAPELPPGYSLVFYGNAEMMDEGARDFAEVFVIAIVMTYLLIAGIMESWVRPFIIMFTVPLGFVGLFLSIYLMNMPFSMVGMLGGVMMIGIVVNNAILLMDEAATLSKNGVPTHEAMMRSCRNKFKPIVMTSIASVIGMLPMAFGTGLGSEIRSSCGVGVVGGLVFAAIFTVYLIPAMYFKFVRDSSLGDESFAKRIKRFFLG